MKSGRQFYIPVQRWLARDQEDGEICREFPVLNKGQPILPGSTHKTCLPKSGRMGSLVRVE